MVLDLLALTGIPVGIATAEGLRHAKSEEEGEEAQQYRMRDFHLTVYCSSKSRKRHEVHGAAVVLARGKLYLSQRDETGRPRRLRAADDRRPHPFTGFYLDFQPARPARAAPSMFERLDRPPPVRGLVSTVARDPPTLNWVFVDKNTCEVRYGPRADIEALERRAEVAARGSVHASGVGELKPSCLGAIVGPWDWTEDEVGLTLEGWEGFVAVEEERGVWAVYYDRDDDGLAGVVEGKRVLQCSLERKVLEDEDEEQDIHPKRK